MKECRNIIILFLLITHILTGCTNLSQYSGIKKESTSIDEKIFPVDIPPDIEINSDVSNIEIFNWDENSVKFEILKRIKRVHSTEKDINAEYEKFKIITEQNESKIYFKNEYEGNKKNPLDQSLDLKIYIPHNIKSISICLELGKITIHDDLNCNVITDLKMANMVIKRLEGLINFKGDMSNIKISGGTLYDGSNININMGNIDLKFKYQEGGNYEFTTKTGNIDIYLPETSKINLDITGYVYKNQLKNGDFPTKIKIKTDMGRICINKYS
jgi:hypothetical protein